MICQYDMCMSKTDMNGCGRRRVRASIDGVEAAKFPDYEGREGLEKLADGLKARGRQLLARQAAGK